MSPDDELLQQLRRIAGEVDPTPELVSASARAAFSVRRLDDELAELVRDSDLSSAAVRGAESGARSLSFESGDVSLELQLEQVSHQLVLRGVAIGTAGDAEIESMGGDPVAAGIDEQGWFRIEALPPAPLRVRVRSVGGATVSTGWIRF